MNHNHVRYPQFAEQCCEQGFDPEQVLAFEQTLREAFHPVADVLLLVGRALADVVTAGVIINDLTPEDEQPER